MFEAGLFTDLKGGDKKRLSAFIPLKSGQSRSSTLREFGQKRRILKNS